MPTETRQLPLPLKGVNRNWPRGAQPPLTCWDSMNVLPFDRQGRTRLALRAGAGKVDRLDAASPVRLLHIASTVNTGVSSGSSPVFSETFSYSDGVLSGRGGWASIAFYDDWVVDTDTAIISPSTETFDDWANQNDTAMSTVTLASDDYTVTVVAHVKTSSGGCLLEIFPEGNNAGDPTASGNYKASFLWDLTPGVSNATFADQYGSPATGYVEIPFDADVTLTITVVDRAVTLSVNGVDQVFSGAITVTNAAFKRFAFRANTTGASDGDVIIRSIMISTPTAAVAVNRTTLKLIGVSGTDTYMGNSPSTMTLVANSATYPIDADSMFVSAATLFGFTYIVDGTSIRKLNLATGLFEAYTASSGTAPTGCTIAVGYRGRLVLSGSDADAQNFFASAVGDPTDWNYGASAPTRAFAGNASLSGRIAAPVQALMPLSDDIMLIAGESYVYAMRGDIAADNGAIDQISSSAGCVSQNAWCIAADGAVYFVGHNGLYRSDPNGSSPVEVSRDVYKQFFQGVDGATNHVALIYDPTRYGIWVFVSPEDSADAPGTHIFYYVPTESFWPVQFTYKPDIGPLSVVYWNGFGSEDQFPVLGGYLGDISEISFTNRRDNGDSDNVLISGYVVLGPFQAGNDAEGILTQISVVGGEVQTGANPDVWHMTWTVKGGASAFSVTEGTAQYSAVAQVTLDRWRGTHSPRVRGQWFTVRLGNEFNDGDYFSLEQVSVNLIPSGRIRRPG